MIERLAALSPRAMAVIAAGLFILAPVAGWVGYNFGYWMATH